jgi:Glycosyl hydrolases family 35
MGRRVEWMRGALVAVLAGLASAALGEDRVQHVVGTANNEVRVVNTYPEHWVDGKPFVMHAAAFFYHRTPRDRWAAELAHLRALGINTIDLYPFWNWHQPEEDVLDFDGHTNPRRDLKYLLRLIDRMGFKATLRPGPFFCNEWRNGGYPDWLLRRPEYEMSLQSVLEGRYPRYSALEYAESERAAEGWLANPTHLRHTAAWYERLLGLAEPYLAARGGNILHIQLDDDQGCDPANYNGPHFYEYMDTLRKSARQATHHCDVPYYINGSEMRENAEAGDALPEPLWNMGQDYQMFGPGGFSSIQEGAKNKFNTDTLKTEPLFPPTIIEFGAGFRLHENDSYETPAHEPSNTLMASRVMFQNGLKGLNYFSLNDTLFPAGYEAPWANYNYPREGAIDYLGRERGRAPYARRNGRLIEGLGHLLGASHALADAALAYAMGTFPQAEMTAEEAYYVYNSAKRILWSGAYAHYNFELVDPDHAPFENLERYSVLLLFNPAAMERETGAKAPHLQVFSDKAQRQLQRFLRSGGTVLVFPSLPGGEVFREVFRPLGAMRALEGDSMVTFADGGAGPIPGYRTILADAPARGVEVFARDAEGGVVGARYAYGEGRVVFFGGDFSRWSMPPEQDEKGAGQAPHDLSAEAQLQARSVVSALMKAIMGLPRAYPELETTAARDPGLYVTELIADFGRPFGFVGVTNFTTATEYGAPLVAADPRHEGGAPTRGVMRLHRISLPPRESVMLPVHLPLDRAVSATTASLEPGDEIEYATVELSRAGYDGRVLSLELTAPMDGEVALRLAARPVAARLDGKDVPVAGDGAQRPYVVRIPKGTGPDFLRQLQLDYPRAVPSLRLEPRAPWLAGETGELIARIKNPTSAGLKLELDLKANGLEPAARTESLDVAPGAVREQAIRFTVPADTPDAMIASVRARLSEKGRLVAADTVQVPLQARLSASVEASSAVLFPLREDLQVPILHPLLASVDLPGSARFRIEASNRGGTAKTVDVRAVGEGLLFSPASAQLTVPGSAKASLEITATPQKGTGAYRFTITVSGEGLESREDVVLAAVARDEAIAYELDVDRDGFADLVLENRELRCFISPHAGGRSFALVRKRTGGNAFTSVGGLRDSFSRREMPADLQGIEDGLSRQWLGLYNRPYAFRILGASGRRAGLRLTYEAPDVYPKGARLERTLVLPGIGNVLLEAERVTPFGVAEDQAFVRECSVPFRKRMEPPYSQWLVAGEQPRDFAPETKTDLPLDREYFATINRGTGDTFAVIPLTKAARWQLGAQVHSALLSIRFPDFGEGAVTGEYRIGYSFADHLPGEAEQAIAADPSWLSWD